MNADTSGKFPHKIDCTPGRKMGYQELLVNLAPREEALELQLSLHSRRNTNISFCFSDEPHLHSRINLYLIPLRCLFWLRSIPLFSGKTVFVYGPAYGLPGSFLAGCSDYLKEPWEVQELICRAQRLHHTILIDYPWGTVRLIHNECIGPGGSVVLSPTEDTILRTLIRNRRKRVEKELLSYLLWDSRRENSRALDMHIVKLRKKMKSILPTEVRTLILTCRPGGYMLR